MKLKTLSKICYILAILFFLSPISLAASGNELIALTAQEQYEKESMEQVEKNADDALRQLEAEADKNKAEYYAKVKKEEFLKEAEAKRQQWVASLDPITKDYINCDEADGCYRKMFMANLWQENKENKYLVFAETSALVIILISYFL